MEGEEVLRPMILLPLLNALFHTISESLRWLVVLWMAKGEISAGSVLEKEEQQQLPQISIPATSKWMLSLVVAQRCSVPSAAADAQESSHLLSAMMKTTTKMWCTNCVESRIHTRAIRAAWLMLVWEGEGHPVSRFFLLNKVYFRISIMQQGNF